MNPPRAAGPQRWPDSGWRVPLIVLGCVAAYVAFIGALVMLWRWLT